MTIDNKLAHILSDFFADIAKAYFIAIFISPVGSTYSNFLDFMLFLTKGIFNVIVFLYFSWQLAKVKEKLEKNE